jgi:hypothetical protein
MDIHCLGRMTRQHAISLRKSQELPHVLHQSNRFRGQRMEETLGLLCLASMLAQQQKGS